MFCELTRDDVFRLETRRLWLRWPTAADSEAMHRIAADREVALMTATWPHPLPEGEAARRIDKMRSTNANGHSLVLALAPKVEPGKIVGCAGAFAIEAGIMDLGYFLAPDHWGRGYMTETVAAIVEASFRCSTTMLVRAGCWSHNTASRRVLEKCGFSGVGVRPCKALARSGDGALQAEHFELTRPEWHALMRTRRIAA